MSTMKRRIYVELDGLLDTRLGTLILMDEVEAQRTLTLEYATRKTDDWATLGSSIESALYARKYERRDEETLKASRCTGMIPMIHRMTHGLEEMGAKTPLVEEIVVDVNFWPYRLSDDVTLDILTAVRTMVSPSVNVDSVWFSPDELSPGLIDRSWDGMIIYDFNGWLMAQKDRLIDKRIPRIPFICPALYANAPPKPGETYDNDIGEVDPFAALEMLLSEYLMLHMVEPKFFSLVDLNSE